MTPRAAMCAYINSRERPTVDEVGDVGIVGLAQPVDGLDRHIRPRVALHRALGVRQVGLIGEHHHGTGKRVSDQNDRRMQTCHTLQSFTPKQPVYQP